MFDMSSGELLIIAVAALVFIKPKDLPAVLRTVGQYMAKIRRMASEFQDQFRDAMREAEMADLKKDIDTATGNLGGGLDPFADIKAATEWKPSEAATVTNPPAADAPPVPPAEAITGEPAPASAPVGDAKPDMTTPHGDVAATPPAGGDRAA
jgi:sec-independent protein translocase protein TatB